LEQKTDLKEPTARALKDLVKFESLGVHWTAACCEPSSSEYSISRCLQRDSSLIRLSGLANVVTQLGCAQIDRLPAARPGTPLVQSVELDALTGDFDLFRHKILLIFRRGLLRSAVAYGQRKQMLRCDLQKNGLNG
jgi:hypothetical protein